MLSQVNPLHPNTSFIARHIEHQTTRLRTLIEAFERLSSDLQTLFFGPHIEGVISFAKDSLTPELNQLLVSLCGISQSIKAPCASVETILREEQASPERVNQQFDLHVEAYQIASKGRQLCAPVMIQCTDNRLCRDFVIADAALDNFQRICLAMIFGFTGDAPDASNFPVEKPCHRCGIKHFCWTSPAALMFPWMRRKPGDREWKPAIECRSFRIGIVVRMAFLIASLLPGLKTLHPNIEEGNALMNDWAAIVNLMTQNVSNNLRWNSPGTVDMDLMVCDSSVPEIQADGDRGGVGR